MSKFRVGDIVEFYGVEGAVKQVCEDHLFVKRNDGIGGPAWIGTPQAGLWYVGTEAADLIKKARTGKLENK